MIDDLDKNLETIQRNDLNIIRWLSIFLLPYIIMGLLITFTAGNKSNSLNGELPTAMVAIFLGLIVIGPSIAITLTSSFSKLKKAILVVVLLLAILPSTYMGGVVSAFLIHGGPSP